ncbi:uncharacterized protein LOC143889756 isoform X2 [Tasmannia lanceolata]|uniref:uncharacterized protein LOC143889756 isoform X2 n=1 Tax=Tasmannia lanceolata TaxID=3420 RepID=UPI00406327F4
MEFSQEDESKTDDSDSSFSHLLTFASKAQTLISELLLLSSRIPPEFRDPHYDQVLFDLRYFDSPDDYEARIEGNVALEALEDQLRESCSAFMERFFLLANGVVLYYQELVKYLHDLQEGVHVQSTLERVMVNENGRQLLTESLKLFGCLLLLMEHRMGGFLREKLLVAYVRHDRCFDAPNLDNICSLCRSHSSQYAVIRQFHTSASISSMISVPKPENLFSRFPFPAQVLDAIISRLRDDDLYNQVRHYPDPEHRTVALESQGGSLYVLLFFSPEFLHNGFVMREIVDRFFKDCWVVPVFMYFVVDLSSSWDAYKAAKTSLSSCLSLASIRDLSQLHCTKVKDLLLELGSVMSDGIISRDFVLNNSQSLLSLVRNCNVSLRWLLLHRSSIDKKIRDTITLVGTAHAVEEDTLLLLLLKTSQLEFELKQLYKELLDTKEALWQESRRCVSVSMQGLSEYYSGSQALSWKIKDQSLKDLFQKLSLEVSLLDYTKSVNTGRKLYHVVSVLKEVEEFYQIEENLQIKQHLLRIQKCLQDMLRVLNLNSESLSTISVITYAVYAWDFFGTSTKCLWKKIEQDPSIVLNLHSYFLKFHSMLDVPLIHMSQIRSPDLLSVSNYYSSEYVDHICTTLEIIPVILFRILNDDVVCTLQPFHLPNRIERDNLQDFLQLDRQFHLAKAVNMISVFSQGLLIMSRTFLGLINLDLKTWLEGEMRKELSKQFRNKLKSFFLSSNVGLEELELNVQSLKTYILSQLHLIECFEDLFHIKGHHLWEEEFTRILKHCAKEEHDNYVRRRKQDSTVSHAQLNDFSKPQTFLGHLLHHILQLTNPSRSMYIEPMSGWFDAEGQELLGLHFFDLLESCVGPVGMAILDSLVTFLITENLEHALRGLNNLLDARCLEELQTLDGALGPTTSLPLLGLSSYKRMTKIMDTSWEPLVEHLACIGQLQLLRCLISLKLKSACKVKAGVLSFAVDGMIASVSSEREILLKNVVNGEANKVNDGTAEYFQELSKQGMLCGFCSPFQTIYISEDPPTFLARCVSIMTISQFPRYVLDTHLGTLTSRRKSVVLDFSPVVIGLGTFLRQFHPTYMTLYVQYMGQYIRTMAETAFGTLYEPHKGSADPTTEVSKSVFWLMYFCKHMGIPKDLLDSCLPPSLFSILQT